MLHTAESDSAVCITPQNLLHTSESESKTLQVSAWLLLKGQSDKIRLLVNTAIMGKKYMFTMPKILTPWGHAQHTRESEFYNFMIKYLGEINTNFKNTSGCLSGDHVGSNHGKNI